MKSIKNKTILFLFLILFLHSCSSDKNDNGLDEFECSCEQKTDVDLSDLIGKWKLRKVQTVFLNPRVYDYSSNDIIYDFRPDGVLIVSSDIGEFVGGNAGEFSYSLSQSAFSLQIDQTSKACCLSDINLKLDGSSLDGPILCLVKVQ
jgi:hypothetical protein